MLPHTTIAALDHAQNLISGLLVNIAISIIIAAFIARKYGGHSRSNRQIIFSIVSIVSLIGFILLSAISHRLFAN